MLEEKTNSDKKREWNWVAVLYYIHIHVLGIYGLWLIIVGAKWMTIAFTFVLTMFGILGLTAGAHRLWAHNSYKASRFIKLFLTLAHSTTGTGSIHNWVIDHRIHHKYYGTDKDTHNHRKGFLYSHVISNILTQHPDYKEMELTIDRRDIETDYFVRIQHQLYPLFFIFFALLLPVNAPAEYWDEDLVTSVFVLGFFRLAVLTNASFFINSGLLVWGLKDTDKYPPDDNLVFYINRNFWPKYHYLTPWDYKTGEYSNYDSGFTSFMIKMFYELGLVSELRTNTCENVREALYKLATKKVTQDEMLDELHTKANYNAIKSNYVFHH